MLQEWNDSEKNCINVAFSRGGVYAATTERLQFAYESKH